MRSFVLSGAALMCAALLTACGGGGGDGQIIIIDPPVDRPRPNPFPFPSTKVCSAAGMAASALSRYPTVCMLTSSGEIVVELFPEYAPITVANFLRYVGDGFYSSTLIHRVDRGFVAQGGGYLSGHQALRPSYAPILLESNNQLSNWRGTLAMARGDAPNSANSQFFFNIGDNNKALDFQSYAPGKEGYAVFGQIISGLNTLDAISAVPVIRYDSFDIRPRTEVLVYWTQRLK